MVESNRRLLSFETTYADLVDLVAAGRIRQIDIQQGRKRGEPIMSSSMKTMSKDLSSNHDDARMRNLWIRLSGGIWGNSKYQSHRKPTYGTSTSKPDVAKGSMEGKIGRTGGDPLSNGFVSRLSDLVSSQMHSSNLRLDLIYYPTQLSLLFDECDYLKARLRNLLLILYTLPHGSILRVTAFARSLGPI